MHPARHCEVIPPPNHPAISLLLAGRRTQSYRLSLQQQGDEALDLDAEAAFNEDTHQAVASTVSAHTNTCHNTVLAIVK
jgi:hypothetical protein